MRRIRRLALVLFVWVNALALALGNVPYILCQCPDGSVKLFCSGVRAKAEAKCCDHGCCHATTGAASCCEADVESEPSCCRGDAEPAEPSPDQNNDTGPAFSKTCCQRTVVQAKTQSLTRAAHDGAEVVVGADPSHSLDVVVVPPHLGLSGHDPVNGHHPPDVHLVILLQRFTI